MLSVGAIAAICQLGSGEVEKLETKEASWPGSGASGVRPNAPEASWLQKPGRPGVEQGKGSKFSQTVLKF